MTSKAAERLEAMIEGLGGRGVVEALFAAYPRDNPLPPKALFQADLAAILSENKRLREALTFYAEQWTVPPIGPREAPAPTMRLDADHGRLARTALAEGEPG